MARKKTKSKKAKSTKTIDLTLRLNVELEHEKARPKRVKRIKNRKRQNLREMRRGMGGTLQQKMSAPNFFGNTAMLTNAAMSAMNNKSYALEQQIRDNQSEIKAFIQAGNGDNNQVRRLQVQNQALIDDLERTQTSGRRHEHQIGRQHHRIDQMFKFEGEQAQEIERLKVENLSITQQMSQMGSKIRNDLSPSLSTMDVSSIQKQTPQSEGGNVIFEAARKELKARESPYGRGEIHQRANERDAAEARLGHHMKSTTKLFRGKKGSSPFWTKERELRRDLNEKQQSYHRVRRELDMRTGVFADASHQTGAQELEPEPEPQYIADP